MTTAPPIDLHRWHRDLHQVTGRMALHFNRATTADLYEWSAELTSVAEQMRMLAAERREDAAP